MERYFLATMMMRRTRYYAINLALVVLLLVLSCHNEALAESTNKPSFSLGAIGEVGNLIVPEARGTSRATVSGFGGQAELRFIIPAGKSKARETLEVYVFGSEFKGKAGSQYGDLFSYGAGLDIAFRFVFVGGQGFSAAITSVNGNYSYDTTYFGYGARAGFRIPLSSSSNGTFLSFGAKFTTGQSYVQPTSGTRSVVDHNQITGFLGINIGLDTFF